MPYFLSDELAIGFVYLVVNAKLGVFFFMVNIGFGLDLGVILKNFNNKSAIQGLKYKECGLVMKKTLTVALMVLSVVALCVLSVPNGLGSPADIKILSYSWYVSPSTSANAGNLVVIGEVQNMGLSILDYVTVEGVAYGTDGQAQAYSYCTAYVDHMLPLQKAPFYMDFSSQNSLSGNLSWIDQGIGRFDLSVSRANEIVETQYPDLAVVAKTSYVDTNGIYGVVGYIQNTGLNLTGKVWVVGTFYNSSGAAILAGYSKYLTNSLSANSTVQFYVSPLDNIASLTSQITSYSLLIQNQKPTAESSPTPAVTQSASPSPTVSPSTSALPTQSPTPQSESSLSSLVYVVVGLVVVVVAVVVVLLLRMRRKPGSGSSSG